MKKATGEPYIKQADGFPVSRGCRNHPDSANSHTISSIQSNSLIFHILITSGASIIPFQHAWQHLCLGFHALSFFKFVTTVSKSTVKTSKILKHNTQLSWHLRSRPATTIEEYNLTSSTVNSSVPLGSNAVPVPYVLQYFAIFPNVWMLLHAKTSLRSEVQPTWSTVSSTVHLA